MQFFLQEELNLEEQVLPSSENMDIDENVETDEEINEITETPRKHKMRKTINRLKFVSTNRLKKIKNLSQKNRRLKTKNKKLKDVIEELKKKRLLNEEEEMQLNLNDKTLELMNEFKKSFKKKRTFKKFPFALKKFALTLNFYSPAAYKYVRSALNNCLPHPRTLVNWYNKINGDPGFTSESFRVLKVKSDNSKSKVICNLVIDEMAIRQQKIFDGKKHHGYVDFGLNDTNDGQNLASSALVLLLVCLNQTWKIPIGYFFTHGLSSDKLANIINLALSKCAEINVEVVSVTCDGSQTNIAAMRVLGCKLNDPKSLKTTFKHPATGNDVVLMLDACHMLKLVRNSFESKRVFININNDEINWKYVKGLQEIQEIEGLRTGNKLTNRHINFRNQIMKVKLASQLLSNSVAQSLHLAKDYSPEFLKCEPTAEFIKIHNDVFDVLNSKGDPKAYGFKEALKPKTKAEIFRLIEKYKEYVTNLKVEIMSKKTIKRKGQIPNIIITKSLKHVIDCKFKTGFLGFLVCLESLKILFSRLIDSNIMKYMATYRLSQDHLELFFGCIRQRGGYNNNPNVIQFRAAYKKLLNHLELKSTFRGNCIPLEKINVLSCVTSTEDHVEEINKSSSNRHDNSDSEKSETVKQPEADLEEEWVDEETNKSLFSNITKQIVGYISGYVVDRVGKELKCETCIKALLATELKWFHKLIVIKDMGGLCYPSQHVFEICMTCEGIIRHAIAISNTNSLSPKFGPVYLATKTLEKLEGNNLIKEFAIHPGDHLSSLQIDHSLLLINAIIHKYIKIRLYHESKLFTQTVKKETKRQLYTKLMLHSGV